MTRRTTIVRASASIGFVIAAGAMLMEALAARPTSPSMTVVHVTLRDYRITMSQTHLPARRKVEFVITNRGPSTHEVVLEPAGAVDKALKVGGMTYEADGIKPGMTHTIVWAIPRAGRFQLGCHIDHHFQMGMKTVFSVTST